MSEYVQESLARDHVYTPCVHQRSPRSPARCAASRNCQPPRASPRFRKPRAPSLLPYVYLMLAPTTLATLTGPLLVMKGTPLYTATHSAVVLKSGWTCGRGAGVKSVDLHKGLSDTLS